MGRSPDGGLQVLRRVQKLAAQPAFQAAPLKVLGRAVRWSAAVALSRPQLFPLFPQGPKLTVPLDFRYTSVTAYLLRDWLEPDLKALDLLIRPGDVVLDIGANIGVYALKAGALVGEAGKVVALEPGEVAFGRLSANIALNRYGWVRPVRAAVSDFDGEIRLHHVQVGHDPQAFTTAHSANADGFELVPAVTIDTLVQQQRLERVDLIKIDVEGAEPAVLRGAKAALARFRPKILCELNAAGHDNSGEAWDLLIDSGYRCWRWAGGRYMPLSARPDDFCNVLATPLEALGEEPWRAR
jgi:FkbM family methyltransferase